MVGNLAVWLNGQTRWSRSMKLLYAGYGLSGAYAGRGNGCYSVPPEPLAALAKGGEWMGTERKGR